MITLDHEYFFTIRHEMEKGPLKGSSFIFDASSNLFGYKILDNTAVADVKYYDNSKTIGAKSIQVVCKDKLLFCTFVWSKEIGIKIKYNFSNQYYMDRHTVLRYSN